MSKRKKPSRDQKRKTKLAKREQKRKKKVIEYRRNLRISGVVESFGDRLAAMWSLERIEPMTTQEIIEKLRVLGIEFDENEFVSKATQFHSSSDLAEHLWCKESDRIAGPDQDFPWMSAGVLWKRLCPDLANSNTIIDGIDAGDDLYDAGNKRAACDRWWQVWEDLKSRFLHDTNTIETVQERVGDYYIISKVLIDFHKKFGEIGADDPKFLQMQNRISTEIHELLPDSPPDFLKHFSHDPCETERSAP